MNKVSNKITGALGEEIASKYLQNLGYKILERNFHYSRYSEIDIIAKEKDSIVFVEVKTRKTKFFGHPLEAITQKKLENIYKAAMFYLQTTNETYKNYRIDVISILGADNYEMEHIKNISTF